MDDDFDVINGTDRYKSILYYIIDVKVEGGSISSSFKLNYLS